MKNEILLSIVCLTLLTCNFQQKAYCFEVKNPYADTALVLKLNEIAFTYRSSNPDSTLFFADSAYQLALDLDYVRGICRSLYNLGVGYHVQGRFDTAYSIYNKAIPIASREQDHSSLSKLYNNMGLVQWNRGEYAQAIDFFLNSLKIDEQLQDRSGQASSLNNIGLIYKSMNNTTQALEYYRKALLILQELGDDFRMSQVLNNMGQIWEGQKSYDSALWYFKASQSLANTEDYSCYQAFPVSGIANIMFRKHHYDSVIFYAEKAYKLSKKCGLPKIQAGALNLLGQGNQHLEKYNKAEYYFRKAWELSDRLAIPEGQKSSAYGLYELYKRRENYKSALHFHELYEQKRFALLNESKIREITQIESAHKAENERQELVQAQEKERLQLNDQLAKEARVKTYMLIGFITFLTITLVVYFIYKREKRLSAALRQKNEKIGQLTRFQNAVTHMIAHDLKNALSTILSASGGQQAQSMRNIHLAGHFAVNLVSNMLEVQKFEESHIVLHQKSQALSELVEEARAQLEHHIKARDIQIVQDVSSQIALKADQYLLVRVIFNLLHNAIKFSGLGARIEIFACYQHASQTVGLTIKDYGKGIATSDLPFVFNKYWYVDARPEGSASSSTGLGLTFCKRVVEAHDGTIEAASEEGRWTTFKLTLKNAKLVPASDQQEAHSLIPEASIPALTAEECRLLQDRLPGLGKARVYQVSELMPILERLDKLEINTRWKQRLRASVDQCDEASFRKLLSGLI